MNEQKTGNIWVPPIVIVLLALAATFYFGNDHTVLFAQSNSDERIWSFDSQITVEEDGSLHVVETIAVMATGQKIKGGIYRDFPLSSPFHNGVTEFEVLDVKRNGSPMNYDVNTTDAKRRIRIFEANETLEAGLHVYRIEYRTKQQLDFLRSDRDRLHWNVTGLDWTLPIDRASATVYLPDAPAIYALAIDAATGRIDRDTEDYKTEINDAGNLFFETTRTLTHGEAFKISVDFPSGIVARPPPKTTPVPMYIKTSQIHQTNYTSNVARTQTRQIRQTDYTLNTRSVSSQRLQRREPSSRSDVVVLLFSISFILTPAFFHLRSKRKPNLKVLKNQYIWQKNCQIYCKELLLHALFFGSFSVWMAFEYGIRKIQDIPPIGVIMCCCAILICSFVVFIEYKCPKCKRAEALRLVGPILTHVFSSVSDFQCKYCAYTETRQWGGSELG